MRQALEWQNAILLDLKLRDYCTEHGLNLHEVRTDAWFQWCEKQLESKGKDNAKT